MNFVAGKEDENWSFVTLDLWVLLFNEHIQNVKPVVRKTRGQIQLASVSIKEEVNQKKIRQKKTGTRTPCFQSLGVKQEEIQIYQFAYCCRHCALKHEVGKIKYRAREKREEKNHVSSDFSACAQK